VKYSQQEGGGGTCGHVNFIQLVKDNWLLRYCDYGVRMSLFCV